MYYTINPNIINFMIMNDLPPFNSSFFSVKFPLNSILFENDILIENIEDILSYELNNAGYPSLLPFSFYCKKPFDEENQTTLLFLSNTEIEVNNPVNSPYTTILEIRQLTVSISIKNMTKNQENLIFQSMDC